MLLRQAPIIFRKHRRPLRRPPAAPPTPPAGPVLSAAEFSAEDARVNLFFDGYDDMDVDAFDPATITVNDPASGAIYQAVAATTVSGFIVLVGMTPVGESSGSETRLNASPGNGIVDGDTGAAWAGVTGLALPFP